MKTNIIIIILLLLFALTFSVNLTSAEANSHKVIKVIEVILYILILMITEFQSKMKKFVLMELIPLKLN